MADAVDGETLPARFAREGLERNRRAGLMLCGFAAALLIVSQLFSPYGDPGLSAELLRIRLATLCGLGLLAWAFTTSLGAQRPRELTVAALAMLSLCLHALAQSTGGQFSIQYDRLSLVILGPAILFSWSAAWAALSSATVIGVYVIGSVLTGGQYEAPFSATLARLIAAGCVTIGGNLMRERARWRTLSDLYGLTAARQRVEAELRHVNDRFEQRVLDRTSDLRTSEERFRTMFEAAPMGVVTVDAGGQLAQSNRAFAGMLGYGVDEMLGRRIEDLASSEDSAALLEVLAALRTQTQSALSLDTRYLRRDGTAVSTHAALTPIHDEAGRFLCALAMIEDVTDRVRAAGEARQRQEHLAHVLRMATMGGMVAELAHELNQPLGAIVNYANGTSERLRQAGGDPALVETVAQIAAEGMRAGEIIRRVRDCVRPGAVPTEPVDLNGLVRQSAQLIESDAQHHQIPVRLRLDPAVPAIALDRLQVEQVLLNLLRNAIDAMQAAPAGDHELVVQTLMRDRAGVEVQVRDTGVGVAPEALGRIFDAFFTTKPLGLGMGLSISRSIVEAYGGRLWAMDNADRGMTFAFSLPSEGRY
ncbi:MAG: PAS domain S-box protein [bacterium]